MSVIVSSGSERVGRIAFWGATLRALESELTNLALRFLGVGGGGSSGFREAEAFSIRVLNRGTLNGNDESPRKMTPRSSSSSSSWLFSLFRVPHVAIMFAHMRLCSHHESTMNADAPRRPIVRLICLTFERTFSSGQALSFDFKAWWWN